MLIIDSNVKKWTALKSTLWSNFLLVWRPITVVMLNGYHFIIHAFNYTKCSCGHLGPGAIPLPLQFVLQPYDPIPQKATGDLHYFISFRAVIHLVKWRPCERIPEKGMHSVPNVLSLSNPCPTYLDGPLLNIASISSKSEAIMLK